MLIVHERKRKEFTQLFPNIDSFVEYLKMNNSSINFDNENIQEKIVMAYKFFIETDEVIQYTRLTRNLHRGFNFKHKNITKKDFWTERGWSDGESDIIIQKDKLKRATKQSVTKKLQNKDRDILIIDGVEKEFRYISGAFFSIEKPICNHCGNDLILNKININNNVDKFYYKISHCSFEQCDTHKMKKNDKYLSFLPNDIANKTIDDIANNIKEKNILSINSWVNNGFSEEEAKKEIFKIQSKNSKKRTNPFIPTKENLKKYGYSEEEIIKICLAPTEEKFWTNKGFSEDEASGKVSELQKVNSLKFSEKRKQNPGAYSAVTHTQLAYWTNKGLSKEDATAKLKERQSTFSFEKCIEKFGVDDGRKIFTERQNKWSKSLNENGNLKIGYSKTSQDLFYSILDNYPIEDREGVFFATKNNEFKINREEGGIWMYDFSDLKTKKIIEFHGDMYHGNPKKYLAEDYPHPFRKNITAQEMWSKDELKIKKAKEEGFDVLIIWDSEYRWGNKQEVINKCLNFLEIKK